MIYNNEEILMLKKLSIIMFSLGDDFICSSNLFDHCREVQFDCPEETGFLFSYRQRKVFASNKSQLRCFGGRDRQLLCVIKY